MTAIYHITHISNLPGILAEGGLWCDAEAERRGLAAKSIAHQNIKERRKSTAVPCGQGGCVADYVPFYFAPRSPMLYSIHTGFVAGYEEGQRGVLHLVSSTETIRDAGLGFVFTDGHAVMALTAFYDDFADLGKIDWAVMKSKYWKDTQADPDRKRRRQAEFLVRQFLPFQYFSEIGVCTTATAVAAAAQLTDRAGAPRVNVRTAWYY